MEKHDIFDLTLTSKVINATGPKASPRTREVFGSLVQHLHDFMRENMVTMDELMAGIDLIDQAGKMSNASRNESLLIADLLGLESVADEISTKLLTSPDAQPTESTLLGPFWKDQAPFRSMGDSIVLQDMPGYEHVHHHGTVRDFSTSAPIEGAVIDVWLTAPNGMYEGQDGDQPPFNLRGKFMTGKDGRYEFYSCKPTAYMIPYDGPGGALLTLLDRHPWRPAHIHFFMSAPGYQAVTTQVYDRTDKYLKNDTVFAVKDSLIVDFKPVVGNSNASLELEFDFKLASLEDVKKFGAVNAD